MTYVSICGLNVTGVCILGMSTWLVVNDHQTQRSDLKKRLFRVVCGSDGLQEAIHIILNINSGFDFYVRYVHYKLLPGARERFPDSINSREMNGTGIPHAIIWMSHEIIRVVITYFSKKNELG